MPDIRDGFRRLSEDFGARVICVPDAAWANPSPCTGWTALDVVHHVIAMLRYGVDQLGAPNPFAPDSGVVREAWEAARADCDAALGHRERASQVIETPRGPMPFELFVGNIGAVELLAHTWDVSRATGLNERLIPQAVHLALSGVRSLGPYFATPGLFAPPVEPAPGASEQDQFLSVLGRRV